MADTKTRKGPQVAPGLYECAVTDQRFGRSDEKGTPYFEVDIVVTHLIDMTTNKTQAMARPYNRNLRLYLTEKNKDNVANRLRALGYNGVSLGALDPGRSGYTNLTGTKVKCWCNHEDNNYGKFEKWDIMTSKGPKDKPPNDGTIASELDSILGDFLAGSVPEANAPVVGASGFPARAYDSKEDDDTPF